MTYRHGDDDEERLLAGRSRIDLRQVYELLRQLEVKLMDALRKLDRLTSRVELLERADVSAGAHGSHAAEQRDDHERRLRKLEAWRYAVPTTVITSGVAAAASVAAAVIAMQ